MYNSIYSIISTMWTYIGKYYFHNKKIIKSTLCYHGTINLGCFLFRHDTPPHYLSGPCDTYVMLICHTIISLNN